MNRKISNSFSEYLKLKLRAEIESTVPSCSQQGPDRYDDSKPPIGDAPQEEEMQEKNGRHE